MTGSLRRSSWVHALLAAMLVTACKRPPLPPHPSDQTPKTRATVITIRMNLQSSNQTVMQTIAIAGGKVRISTDVDAWRLFDFPEKRVTFVDDITKTSRSEPFASIVARHRQAISVPLPDGIPRPQVAATSARRVIAGVTASEWVIRAGAYQRHLWIAHHPSIPDDLFAMINASETGQSQMAGLNRAMAEVILKTPGFPMADHFELPYGNTKLVVDRSVLAVEQRDVPQSWFLVPAADREVVKPAIAPPGSAVPHS